ncbi:NHR-1 protein, partial [Aphelenchoides avenae]
PLPQVRTTREPHTKAPGGTPCAVCGDTASGCYNGVVVCLGCKTFFRRIVVTGEVEKIQCRYVGSCVVNKDLRNACRSCRFNKCLLAGMALEEKRGRHSAMVTSPPPTGWSKMLEITSCAVCSKIATEYHYDVALCDVCFGAVDSDRKDPVPSGKRMMHAPTTTFNEQFRYGNTVLTKFTEG